MKLPRFQKYMNLRTARDSMLQRPSNEMDYKELQVTKYLSFESNHEKWRDGQKRYIHKQFKSLNRNSRILDLGCGDGSGLAIFRELGFQFVTGIEFSSEKSKVAMMYGYTIHEVDFHYLEFLDSESFDVVYSSHSLEHAFDPAKVLSHCRRLLKQKGLLKLVLPFPDTGPIDAHVAKFELGTAFNDSGHAVMKYLKKMGFEVKDFCFDNFREDEIWINAIKK